MKDLVVYCADIGSVAGKRFGWARVADEAGRDTDGKSIDALVDAITADLERGPVALGFECPLWLPYPIESKELGRARPGEGSHSWSAGAGAAVLATGMVQIPWILERLRHHASAVSAYTDWALFSEAGSGLFLREAFISGTGKQNAKLPANMDPDVRDATIAATEFARRSGLGPMAADPPAPEPEAAISIVGSALIAAGWCSDPAIVRRPCLVLKVDGPS